MWEYIADLLARFVGADSVRITAALGLGVGALYARRALAIGHVVGRFVNIGAAVLVVLAVGIISGVLTPNLATLWDGLGTLLNWATSLVGRLGVTA
jgi:hypothetical protein